MKAERWAILDLPLPLEPVCVDLNRPLEEQLPKGHTYEAAKKMLDDEKVSTPIKVTVRFGDWVPDDIQAKAMFDFEINLRERSGLDVRVLKERMGDDSQLRIVMDARRKK